MRFIVLQSILSIPILSFWVLFLQISLLELRTDTTILCLSLIKAWFIQAIERVGFCSSIFTHFYHFIINNYSPRCLAKSTQLLNLPGKLKSPDNEFFVQYPASSLQRSMPQAGPGYWTTSWSPVPGSCWLWSCLAQIGLHGHSPHQ